MASTSPTRIDDELFASAKLVGDIESRSAAQQVVHWARIGREIESSSVLSARDIAAVLIGTRPYDSLGPEEQAVVRAEWSERFAARREALDMAEQAEVEGFGWVEADEWGNVRRGGPGTDDAKSG